MSEIAVKDDQELVHHAINLLYSVTSDRVVKVRYCVINQATSPIFASAPENSEFRDELPPQPLPYIPTLLPHATTSLQNLNTLASSMTAPVDIDFSVREKALQNQAPDLQKAI